MVDIFDIKAMDIDDSIKFRVKFKNGTRFVPADMDFYFEVLEKDVEQVRKFVENCAEPPLVEFVERGWTDVDGRPAVSIKYQRLRDKNSILRIFDNKEDTKVFFFNADIKEEYQWILYHGHDIADFMQNPIWLDIEVDPTDIRKKLKSPHAAYRYSNRIYMIGMSTTNGTSYPVMRRDEKKMLREAYAIASAHSCIVGWNCLHPDTMVYIRDKGNIPMSEVIIGDYVFGIDGWQCIKDINTSQFSGDLLGINGVLCTPEHRVPVYYLKEHGHGRYRKKVIEAKHFDRKNPNIGRVAHWNSGMPDITSRTRNQLLSELVGICLAEGTFTDKESKYFSKKRNRMRTWKPHRINIVIGRHEGDFKDRIIWLFKELWNYDVSIYERRGRDDITVFASNRRFIYEEVKRLLNNIDDIDAGACLRGFFEGDGTIEDSGYRTAVTMSQSKVNIDTFNIIRGLLDKIDIPYKNYEYEPHETSTISINPVLKLDILGYESILKFAALVGFISMDKLNRLFKILNKRKELFTKRIGTLDYKKWNLERVPYTGEVYDFTIEGTPYFFANDVLVHNSKNFDMPYLQGRCDNQGVKVDWSLIPHIDFMEIHKNYMKFKKELGEVVYNGLDRVSEKFLGYGKVDAHDAYRMLPTWWENDWLTLETYCMNDVYLMIDLYNEVDGLRDATNVEVAKVKMAHLEPNRRYPSAFVDNKLTEMSLARNIGIPKRKEWRHRDKGDVCPSCETINEFGAEKCITCGFNLKEEKGKGGWVPDPKLGLDFNTIFVDYYSLYPTIYMTHNIGVNTVDWNKEFEDSIRTEELWFRPEARGLNAEFMEYLLTERKKYRDGRNAYIKGTEEYIHYDMNQEALKTILVAANGVMEEKGFRYKNRPIYDSCTKTGQIYLQFLIEAGGLLGLELKQSDTDGAHFLSPYKTVEETVEHLEEIEKFMYDYVKEKAIERWGLPEKYYAIYPRCEMVCSHFYSIAKKSYVMRIVYDNGTWTTRFGAKGMPGVKYNTLPLLKVILQGIFKEVIFEIEPGGDYIPACVDYLLKIKDDLYSGRRPDYLTFAQSVKSLEGRLPHNRAAKKLDEMGLFEEGMIVHFIRRANGDIILPNHEEYKIDLGTYDRYWKGAVASWLSRLLPEVASEYELGFNVARPNEKLSWL